jgi:hypothetical protein
MQLLHWSLKNCRVISLPDQTNINGRILNNKKEREGKDGALLRTHIRNINAITKHCSEWSQ